MIKVLIVDDELLVRIGLRTMIDWESNGFSIVGEASNANEAIEMFDRFKPEILITDIKMSGIDGLDLIAALKDKWEDFKTIILTHCDDFAFAQKAINLGANEFILKSNLTSESLLTVLNKIANHIKPSSVPSLKEMDVSEYLTELLEKAIVSSIITKTNFGNHIIDSLNKKLFKHFAVTYGMVYSDADEIEVKRNIEKIKEFSSSFLKSSNTQYAMLTINDHAIYLFNFDGKTNNVENQCSTIIEGLRRNIEQYFDVSIVIGTSRVETDIMMIPQMVNQAKVACKECFFAKKKTCHYSEHIKTTVIYENKVNTEQIRRFMESENIDALGEYIDKCFNEAFESHDKNTLRKVFIDFISFAKIIYYENGQDRAENEKFRYTYFEKIIDFSSMKSYVKDVYIFVASKKYNNKYSYSINMSIKYIKENYEKNIALEDVSEYANISKSYLSMLFKQETGINFSCYLTDYRIKKSMELLQESNYKIYEIAEKVGFDNPYYFSKVFKEKTGYSCKHFRKNAMET